MAMNDGIELCARFSYVTNSLEYCGPKSATKLIHDYLSGKKELEDEVSYALEKFEGLLPYFSVMAKKSGKDPFSNDITEAYWIGSEILDDFTKEDVEKIIGNLVKNGLPRFLADKLIEKLPNGAIPHHAFNVFFVGVGQLTGSVATTPENMDNCRISSGKVVSVGEKLKVMTDTLRMEEKGGRSFIFLEPSEKEVDYSFIEPKAGDVVGIHWNRAVIIFDERQKRNLNKYTQKVIDAVNDVSES